MIIKKGDIVKTKGTFKPKAMLVIADEMTELMVGSSENFKQSSIIKECIESIARLGRSAGVHLVLATQRPSSSVISSDLKNNIQMSCLLGGFDASQSNLVFDRDISNLAKPDIKGRGFIKSGNNIIEFQSFWTEPENDFIKNDVNENFIKELQNFKNSIIDNKSKNNNEIKNNSDIVSFSDIFGSDDIEIKSKTKVKTKTKTKIKSNSIKESIDFINNNDFTKNNLNQNNNGNNKEKNNNLKNFKINIKQNNENNNLKLKINLNNKK